MKKVNGFGLSIIAFVLLSGIGFAQETNEMEDSLQADLVENSEVSEQSESEVNLLDEEAINALIDKKLAELSGTEKEVEEEDEDGLSFEYSGKMKVVSVYHREGKDSTNGYTEMELDQNFITTWKDVKTFVQIEARPKFGSGGNNQIGYFGIGTGQSEKIFKLERAYLEVDFLDEYFTFTSGLYHYYSPGGLVMSSDVPGMELLFDTKKIGEIYVNYIKEREREPDYDWDDLQVVNVGANLEFLDEMLSFDFDVYTRFGTAPIVQTVDFADERSLLTFIPSVYIGLDLDKKLPLEINLGFSYGTGTWKSMDSNTTYATYSGFAGFFDAELTIIDTANFDFGVQAFAVIASGDETTQLEETNKTYWTSLVTASEDGVYFPYTSYFFGGGYEFINKAASGIYSEVGVMSAGLSLFAYWKDLYVQITGAYHMTQVANNDKVVDLANNRNFGAEINSYFEYDLAEDVTLNLQADLFLPGNFYEKAFAEKPKPEFVIAFGPQVKW